MAIAKHAAGTVEGKPANTKKMFYVSDALQVLQALKTDHLSSAVRPMLAAAIAAEQSFHRLLGMFIRPTFVPTAPPLSPSWVRVRVRVGVMVRVRAKVRVGFRP